MSDSITVLQLAKDSGLDQQLIINELLEMGGFEKASKYTKLAREVADQVLERIRRKQRMEVEETTTADGMMIRRRRVVVTSDAPVAAPETPASSPRAAKARAKEPEKPAEPPVESSEPSQPPARARRTSRRREEPANTETETPAQPVEPPMMDPSPAETIPFPTAAKEEAPVSAAGAGDASAPAAEPAILAGHEEEQARASVAPPEPAPAPAPVSPEKPAGEKVTADAVPSESAAPSVPAVEPPPSVAQPAKPAPVAEPPAVPEAKAPAAKRFLPSAARPEASASPMENTDSSSSAARSSQQPVMGPKEERKLGPTGRFIVLPTQSGSKTQTRVDGAPVKPSDGAAAPVKPASVSYKEKREEEELLRKTGFAARKKQDAVRPTVPPEGRRKIKVDEFISVSELAHQMGLKATELMKKLLSLGQMVTINSTLDMETASIVASEWGYEIENVSFQEEKFFTESAAADERREKRPPIVTIMGHVDHGKTSLLDAIRKSDIASKESGGITQHIGAYKVKTRDGEIVFIDTPGHEAFSAMRARGASVTDLVVLVVAADDGVMPQTEEAINHCRAAQVPMLVAITKVDKHNANPQMVREKLTAYGLVDENWGGDTIMVEVSAVTKAGLDTLLEMILLQAEMLELTANPDAPARSVVLEAELDRAKGPVVNLLVLDGTLSVGDHVVCGLSGGKIRTLTDDRGRQLKSVGPATPVEVTGFDSVPVPGDECRMVPDEKAAKRILDRRRDEAKAKELARKSQAKGMDAIRQAIARGEQKHLNVILKTDVQGTMEALRDALTRLSNDIVKVNVVHCGVGGINESDINLAITAEGVVMGFRVRPDAKARHRADQEGVSIHQYNVIYDMLDDVRDIMRGMLPKEKKEQQIGRVEVRQVFNIPKVGTVAGCYVVEGKVTRSAQVRVFHDNIQVFEGRLASLRRFKDDVREVVAGYECGISIDGFNDVREGDILEAYEIVETTVEI